ncbi:MAG: trypsin-like peptidase domain-containing protein [Ignavibacteriae bacterium]|nr:trypsin-like peptidase domain-containing protein [Ignavibacteriota bacterium]
MKIRLLVAAIALLQTFPIFGCNRLSPKEPIAEKIDFRHPESRTILQPDVNADITSSRQNAITEAVKKCSPAIVGISVTEVQQISDDPFGGMFNDPFFQRFMQNVPRRMYNQEIHGLGTGFLISQDGYILTNDHVAGSAKKIVVTMTSGEKYDAEIIGTDKVADVALLKIKGKNLPYLKFANSDDVIIGEWAIAFGNPFGLFDINAKPTVTVGVVSNTGVSFPQEGRVYRNMIQTDAAISSGNSGGPLVNSLGEVIGMNTVIFSTAQTGRGAGSIGIGFSIPINRVLRTVDFIKTGGKVDREFVPGLLVQEIDEQMARSYRLEKKEGVVVVQITRNSAAERAGIEPGDIILEVDGTKINRSDDLQVIISDGSVGETLTVTILRGDEKITKKMKLEKAEKGRR